MLAVSVGNLCNHATQERIKIPFTVICMPQKGQSAIAPKSQRKALQVVFCLLLCTSVGCWWIHETFLKSFTLLGGAGAGTPLYSAVPGPSVGRWSCQGRGTEAELSMATFVCKQVKALFVPVYTVEDLTIKKT